MQSTSEVKNDFDNLAQPEEKKYDSFDNEVRFFQYYDSMQYGTRKHNRVRPCGHKFSAGNEPRQRNCESCWFTFFTIHGDVTNTANEVFQAGGFSGLVQVKGPKFAKNYTKYMSTLATYQAAYEAAQVREQHEQSIRGTGSDGSDQSGSTTNSDNGQGIGEHSESIGYSESSD